MTWLRTDAACNGGDYFLQTTIKETKVLSVHQICTFDLDFRFQAPTLLYPFE